MKNVLRAALIAVAVLAVPAATFAEGNLAKTPATKIQIDIKGKPGAATPATIDIETGKYYNLTVTSDGGDEVVFSAPQFFQNIWLNQVVVNDAEFKMFGTSWPGGIEIGQNQPNKVEITFVAIKPADYPFLLNGKMGATLHVH